MCIWFIFDVVCGLWSGGVFCFRILFMVEFIVSCCDLYIRALYKPARPVLSSSPSVFLLFCPAPICSSPVAVPFSPLLLSGHPLIYGILSSFLHSIFINLFIGCIFFIETSGLR